MKESRTQGKTGNKKKRTKSDLSPIQRRKVEMREHVTFTSLSLATINIHHLM